MFERNEHSKDIFEQGYKTVQKGILLFGGSLVLLGILIFLFPALIGYMFAAFILFAGAVFLTAGWKIWRFKKEFERGEEIPLTATFRTEGPHYTRRRIVVVMK